MNIQKQKLANYLISAVALIAFLFLLIYSLTSRKAMYDIFSYGSYYIAGLLIVVWIVQTSLVLKAGRFSLQGLLKKHWIGILVALVLTSFVFSSVKVGFKTLSDETNLLSVSRSMLSNKTVFNCTMGTYYYGNLTPIRQELPVRPFVFPFLTHLLHVITGYRYQNPFVLNFIIMFLFLSGIYIAARKFLDISSSIAAMLFVLAYPVFTVFGTSGGFDLLNSVFFSLAMVAVYNFLKNPSSTTFAFVFSSLLMLANVRYESIIFLFVVPLLLLKRIKWHYLKEYAYLFFAAPLLILPYIWQRMLKPDSHEPYTDVPLFSVTSLTANTEAILKNLIDFRYFLPYAGFLSIVSILILIYLTVEILRKKIPLENNAKYFTIVLSVSFLVSTLIYLSYFFGYYTHPSSARFFITFSVVLALVPVALRVLKPAAISGPAMLMVATVFFLLYHPIAVEGRFVNTLTLNRRTEHCIDFLSKLNDRNIMVIVERPGQYTALGYGTVDFTYANNNRKPLLNQLDRHLFSKMIVFQQIEYKTNAPTSDTTLHPDYNLHTLYEIQVSADKFLRISEITGQ